MQPDYRSPLQTDQRPGPPFSRGNLLKRPQPFHLWNETGKSESLNRQDSQELDITKLPTRKQPRVTLTPEDLLPFEQLDEQLTADLDLSSIGTMKLMQLSGVLWAVRVPERGTAPGTASTSGYGSTFGTG